MRDYFKIVTSREAEMTGAGLGYDEMFGDGPRYFWSRPEANAQAAELNNPPDSADPLGGTYSVERRTIHDDGSWADEGDAYARDQLGLPVVQDA